MKQSFICHPVSKRQVWKEFSQVTKALEVCLLVENVRLRDMHGDVLTGSGGGGGRRRK